MDPMKFPSETLSRASVQGGLLNRQQVIEAAGRHRLETLITRATEGSRRLARHRPPVGLRLRPTRGERIYELVSKSPCINVRTFDKVVGNSQTAGSLSPLVRRPFFREEGSW